MRETLEFRVPEENAAEFLPAGLGTRLGWIRKIELRSDDLLVAKVRRLERDFSARGKSFFYGWEIRRHYSRSELNSAEFLHVWPKRVFEPAGEMCGTEYDESKAYPECGAGAVQKTPLFLDARRIPRRLDFARTIAGEIVVSARVRDVFLEKGLVGGEFDPVRQSNKGGTPSSEHFQLKVAGPTVELDRSTRTGGNLFDETGYGRCPRGHVAGLNLLSEVHIQRGSLVAADVMVTKQMVGVRRGLLRPRPILLLSPKAWRAVEDSKLKGLAVEVAHVS